LEPKSAIVGDGAAAEALWGEWSAPAAFTEIQILQNRRIVATMARTMPSRLSTIWSGAFMRYLLLALMALCAVPGALQAQTMIPKLDDPGRKGDLARAEKQRAAERFDSFDQNKDGKLAREEVASKSAYLTENFVKLDADKDGVLSWEEFLGHNRWPK
jgi:EF hand